MKKILFSLCLLMMMAAGAQAQKSSCSKPCTKSAAASTACHSKAPAAASLTDADKAAAAKLASLDGSIEPRTDSKTGEVNYVRKQTCAHSGAVSYVDVNYDAATKTFVNVSPAHAAEKSAGCGSKATSASGKSCCASGASMGKSCCAGKSKSAEKIKS